MYALTCALQYAPIEAFMTPPCSSRLVPRGLPLSSRELSVGGVTWGERGCRRDTRSPKSLRAQYEAQEVRVCIPMYFRTHVQSPAGFCSFVLFCFKDMREKGVCFLQNHPSIRHLLFFQVSIHKRSDEVVYLFVRCVCLHFASLGRVHTCVHT